MEAGRRDTELSGICESGRKLCLAAARYSSRQHQDDSFGRGRRRNKVSPGCQSRQNPAYGSLTSIFSPLMSILTHLRQTPQEPERTISLIYGARAPQSHDLSKILFLDRLRDYSWMGQQTTPFVKLYLTRCSEEEAIDMRNRYSRPKEGVINLHSALAGRIDREALRSAVDHADDEEWRKQAVVYICGPRRMTDEFERIYLDMGMEQGRVLTKEWW